MGLCYGIAPAMELYGGNGAGLHGRTDRSTRYIEGGWLTCEICRICSGEQTALSVCGRFKRFVAVDECHANIFLRGKVGCDVGKNRRNLGHLALVDAQDLYTLDVFFCVSLKDIFCIKKNI